MDNKRTFAFKDNDPKQAVDITGNDDALQHHLAGGDIVVEVETLHGCDDWFKVSATDWFSPGGVFSFEINEVPLQVAFNMFEAAADVRSLYEIKMMDEAGEDLMGDHHGRNE